MKPAEFTLFLEKVALPSENSEHILCPNRNFPSVQLQLRNCSRARQEYIQPYINDKTNKMHKLGTYSRLYIQVCKK